MDRGFRRAALPALLLAVLGVSPAAAQVGTVEKIEVQGLRRMTEEGFRHALQVKEGDPYDLSKLRAAFHRLWDLNLFEDITMEAEAGPGGGKVLVIRVVERPVLVSISYEDNKVLTRTQIEDRLKEKKVSLEVGKPLDKKAIFDAEATIRDYLGEKGFLDAEVRHELHEVTQTSHALDFHIRPGGKTRIRKIDFVGNKVFSDRVLKKQLTLTRAWRWYWPWSAKSLYHPVKWDQDVGSIRDLYQNQGYLDVEIRPPAIEVKEVVKKGKEKKEQKPDEHRETTPSTEATGKQAEKQRKKEEKARKKEEKARRAAEPKVKRWVYLTVPVAEGEQYRTGKITVTGNTVLTEKEVLSVIPLREGMILSSGLLKAGIDGITLAYGNRGYLYATAVRQIHRRQGERVADIQVTINEDKPYYVSRIEFRGNTTTEDRVLRREVRLNEGQLFNRTLLDISKTKINQLGYFEVKGDPVVEPSEAENRVRITFEGEEKGRNEVQVGGGYSGLDGAFFTGLYSTRNFLGKGEIVSTSLQVGGRTNRYAFQFVEPWFLGSRYSLGFTLNRSDSNYGTSTFGNSLRSSSHGGGIRMGRQIGYFTLADLSYDYQSVTSTGFTISGGEATNTISSLTPGFLHNRVNNPYRPSRGWSVGITSQLAGGFLGGDTGFWRPVANYSGYKKALRRTFFGFHSEVGQIQTFAGGSAPNTATVNGVPRFERFWLGGDTLGPRVFDVRTITPLRFVSLDSSGHIVETVKDPRGQPVSKFDRNGDGIVDRLDLVELGGDRYFLLQSEYVIPFNPSVEAALFLDVGDALFEDSSWGFADARVSAGVEVRFYLPVFPVPLRLIYGVAVRKLPDDRTSSFTFSIGRSF